MIGQRRATFKLCCSARDRWTYRRRPDVGGSGRRRRILEKCRFERLRRIVAPWWRDELQSPSSPAECGRLCGVAVLYALSRPVRSCFAVQRGNTGIGPNLAMPAPRWRRLPSGRAATIASQPAAARSEPKHLWTRTVAANGSSAPTGAKPPISTYTTLPKRNRTVRGIAAAYKPLTAGLGQRAAMVLCNRGTWVVLRSHRGDGCISSACERRGRSAPT